MTHEKVGFVGLGLMGHGMAKNILEKGYPLRVVAHRKRAAVDDLVSRGAVEAASIEDIAQDCTVVMMCLTGSPEVEAAIAAFKHGLAPGAVVVDCSTSDPTITLRLAAELARIGVDFVDAPLSRTPKEAWAGTLDCMVGAGDAAFVRVQPIIATWAARIVHVGAVDDGHKMKLLNNFLSLGYAALYSQALALSRFRDMIEIRCRRLGAHRGVSPLRSPIKGWRGIRTIIPASGKGATQTRASA